MLQNSIEGNPYYSEIIKKKPKHMLLQLRLQSGFKMILYIIGLFILI